MFSCMVVGTRTTNPPCTCTCAATCCQETLGSRTSAWHCSGWRTTPRCLAGTRRASRCLGRAPGLAGEDLLAKSVHPIHSPPLEGRSSALFAWCEAYLHSQNSACVCFRWGHPDVISSSLQYRVSSPWRLLFKTATSPPPVSLCCCRSPPSPSYHTHPSLGAPHHHSISAHLVAPRSAGMFQRAVAESGAISSWVALTLPVAEQMFQYLLANSGCASASSPVQCAMVRVGSALSVGGRVPGYQPTTTGREAGVGEGGIVQVHSLADLPRSCATASTLQT